MFIPTIGSFLPFSDAKNLFLVYAGFESILMYNVWKLQISSQPCCSALCHFIYFLKVFL